MRDVKPEQDEYMVGPALTESTAKYKKSAPRYPKMRLDLDVIPEAKDWEVSDAGKDKGAEYTITLKVKMIGLSQSQYDKSAEFEIRGIEVGDEDEEEGEDNE